MKNKCTAQSAFLNLRLLIALLLCTGAACLLVSGTLLAFFRPEVRPNVSQRTLTFAERVAYQRAIEEVYWRHRIWPKEQPDPKPSLDAVMSEAQLEKKVADYVRKSQALENYWQRPITAAQLQAELDRMALNTKQPEVLKELFDALGNDPFVIAECLARPALAQRLLTSWYAYDQRIHGELKQRAEADLQAHPTVEQLKETSGKYSEIELVKSDTTRDADDGSAPQSVKLNSREWGETLRKLAAQFATANAVGQAPRFPNEEVAAGAAALQRRDSNVGAKPPDPLSRIKVGVLTPLREDETRYCTTAVLNKTGDHLKLATVAWPKEQLESWLATRQNQILALTTTASAKYTLPAIKGTGCSDDTWTDTSVGPDGRILYTAVWTGSEMIVWGGTSGGFDVATGWRYSPSTDTWTPTSMTNAPDARELHSAVWSGTEMIVWGGRLFTFGGYQYWNTGGRYNPGTDSWTATSTANAPSARHGHTAVWTGSEMIVWGGAYCPSGCTYFNTGGRYNPNTDSWTATSTSNAPLARVSHTAVWTGSNMIVWGGYAGGSTYLNTGGRYDPTSDSWAATSTSNAPSVRASHTAVWTGSDMIVWGGTPDSINGLNTGGRYDPGTDSWTATSITNAPDARESHTAVWTGSQMIVWGGGGTGSQLNTGGRYDPVTDRWTATNTASAPLERTYHTAVWTGTEMIVWGGFNSSEGHLNTGGRYDPITDSWVPTKSWPSQRSFHTAVWTGNEMVIWGGIFDFAWLLNSGSRYDPVTDNWSATSTANAPVGRWGHSAVWSGSEMIVWGGGDDQGNSLNTGGRYNPSTDSWIPTSTANAPSARSGHSAVWSGSEMIVWGGYVSGANTTNTGGRYNPGTDSWTATTTTNAPSARSTRAVVWSGSEMIVWGGISYPGPVYFNTGGRYNPGTDSWIATSTTNAPDARASATACGPGQK